jgi:hypothetical protein
MVGSVEHDLQSESKLGNVFVYLRALNIPISLLARFIVFTTKTMVLRPKGDILAGEERGLGIIPSL